MGGENDDVMNPSASVGPPPRMPRGERVKLTCSSSGSKILHNLLRRASIEFLVVASEMMRSRSYLGSCSWIGDKALRTEPIALSIQPVAINCH